MVLLGYLDDGMNHKSSNFPAGVGKVASWWLLQEIQER